MKHKKAIEASSLKLPRKIESYFILIKSSLIFSGPSLTSKENGFSELRIFVAWLRRSLNLVQKFSAKESASSTAQNIRNRTLTKPSL
jgi:hypothetical protein